MFSWHDTYDRVVPLNRAVLKREDAVRYERRLSNGDAAKSARPLVRRANYARARASKKTTTGPFEPFFKSPNLNNNAVTRESIRKMRSANFVSKFLRGPTFGFVFCRDYCLFIFRFVFLYSRCFVGPGRAVEFSCCSFGLNSNLIKPVC